MSAGREDIQLSVFGRDYFLIDPARAALIVVDMQNSFVAPGATFSSASTQAVVPNVNQAILAARDSGLRVIWTQSDHSAPGGGLMLTRFPILRETTELWPSDWSFELYADLVPPLPDDHRVVKHKFDAFHNTDLDAALRYYGVDTVVICGVTTECCCESTARSAFAYDYKVVFLSDATAALDDDAHEQACARIDALFGRVMTTDELVAILERGGEEPARTSAEASSLPAA